MSIQPLTLDNYRSAFALQLACHLHPWSESVFCDCLSDPYFAFQLVEEGQVIGYAIGLLVVDEATLMDIGVGTEKRGTGLGRRMLNTFVEQCVSRGASDIWLEVRASNAAAIHLYTTTGFELIETRKGYYPAESGREDALIMKKALSGQSA